MDYQYRHATLLKVEANQNTAFDRRIVSKQKHKRAKPFGRECLLLYIKTKHILFTSYYLIRHCELKRCKKVHVDAGMLYHKHAVFWLTNISNVSIARPLTPRELFSSKVCTRGRIVLLLPSETCYRSPTLINRLANDRYPLVLNATPLPFERLAAVRKYGDLKSPHQ